MTFPRQLLFIGFLIIVLALGLWVRSRYFPFLTRESTYYFYSFFWIDGLLIIILSANLIRERIQNGKSTDRHGTGIKWPNRREWYRVVYPKSERPVLTIVKGYGTQARQVEYPVADISEQGICFIDDGSLGPLTELEGSVRFKNGEINRIEGQIVRRSADQVCVRLNGGFPWKRVLSEQRRFLSSRKSSDDHEA